MEKIRRNRPIDAYQATLLELLDMKNERQLNFVFGPVFAKKSKMHQAALKSNSITPEHKIMKVGSVAEMEKAYVGTWWRLG